MVGFVQKLFDNNEREVKRLRNDVVARVNALEAWAEAQSDLVAAYAEPGAGEAGVLSLDGQMIERLHLDKARRILARR